MITAEEITLDESILDDSLPCECHLPDGTLCGKPAAYRLISSCGNCNNTVSGFACHPCWAIIRPYVMFREWMCAACHGPRTIGEM